MESHPFWEIEFWAMMAAVLGAVGGGIWLFIRSPFVTRWMAQETERFYAGMAARGRAVALPRTWRSEGFPAHDPRSTSEMMLGIKIVVGLAALVLVVDFLRDPARTLAEGWGLLLWLLLIVGAFAGILIADRIRYARLRRETAEIPRTAFNVVANAHGLFVPVSGGRVIQRSWADWAVTDVRFLRGGTGGHIYACDWISVRHRAESDLHIPLIASMFPDGQALVEVVAARAPRITAQAAGEAAPSEGAQDRGVA